MKNVLKRINKFWVSDVSFLLLLGMLVFTVFILPVFIEYQNDATFFLNAMLILLFFVGVFSSMEKSFIVLSAVLFLIHVSLRLIRFGDNPFDFYLFERIAAILNLIALTVVNLRLLFRDDEVNFYRIIGSINVYLLVSIIGAIGFEVIQILAGTSIVGQDFELSGTDVDFGYYIYYSLTCVSTLGFGDMYPVNFAAKMLSTFLSALGILYPAVIISKLVSYASSGKYSS
ncbi:ion channel [Belliella kenyensis]|uniref:Ion channel n=1 Tax=Belliella kenyensis TaxID=1472724 RepID=A0ABV8ELK5_9BACT|nr:potassium channel family protein [Belliella kenyensis]MCH7403520.1 potassium channel family protein [Belliella kenyensis]MDN3604958.1 potassium channel family protein [Belliella kenyensis]